MRKQHTLIQLQNFDWKILKKVEKIINSKII